MERSATNCELIPNQIIRRNNNYAQRKILINKKFQWLNKYLSATSPKMLNLNTFVSTNKMTHQHSKNRSYTNASRLRTAQRLNTKQQNILLPRNCNNLQLRKTSSAHLDPKQLKKCPQQFSMRRYFRSKKTKSQFSRMNRNLIQKQLRNKNFQIQDSQIRPWNFDENNDYEHTMKQNEWRIRG